MTGDRAARQGRDVRPRRARGRRARLEHEPELAELARIAPGLLPGRIMTCDPVGTLVLTELGATAAAYCASLLLAAARARSVVQLWPKPGDRVAICAAPKPGRTDRSPSRASSPETALFPSFPPKSPICS